MFKKIVCFFFICFLMQIIPTKTAHAVASQSVAVSGEVLEHLTYFVKNQQITLSTNHNSGFVFTSSQNVLNYNKKGEQILSFSTNQPADFILSAGF